MRLVSSLFLFPLLAACTFSAPQFETGVRFVKSISMAERDSEEPAGSRWLASVGDQGAVVMPYSSEGLIVFANANGNAIAFDGWTVRSIIGFGLESPMSISGKEGERRFVMDGSEQLADCDSWQFADGVWEQACDNGLGSISLDVNGNIQTIVMSLGKSLGNVTLRVAK